MSRADTLTPPPPVLDADLRKLMRALKLGRMLDTLPERMALAKQQSLPYPDFLSLVFADEVERRDRTSADLRSRAAKLDPAMRLETFNSDSPVRYDTELWNELCLLRFLDDARGALILGPVGVGKTHLATVLGHIAVRHRHTVRFLRADQMFRTLKAARLDNSVDAEMRGLARVEVLLIDDFALQAMDATETSDFYQLIVERHQRTSTILTSNRDPSEWIAAMSDPLLAQSAVVWLVSTSYELVIEGESYRRRQRPQPAGANSAALTNKEKQVTIILLVWWSLAAGTPVVPSRWQATCRNHQHVEATSLRSRRHPAQVR